MAMACHDNELPGNVKGRGEFTLILILVLIYA
jgi:hypothetical protein